MAGAPGDAGVPGVELSGLGKRFGAVAAVDGVSLAIARGELFALLGPSGCGKTTLLRLIGGLEQPDAGSIRIAGTDVTAAPPHRRPVHTVFQHFALFPHLSVAENVAFGLRYRSRGSSGSAGAPPAPRRPLAPRRRRERRADRAAEQARIEEVLALVRLGGLGRRYPDQLSGGQRQRVALARALAPRPEVLLLDEPLGALDQQLRRAMQVELRGLQRTLGITFVLVTHDQEEALALSDRLAVMRGGRLEQIGSPRDVFERPATSFVAEFMGAANFWTAHVQDAGAALAGAAAGGAFPGAAAGGPLAGARPEPASVALRLACGVELEAPLPPGVALRAGQEVRLVVRPERLALRPAARAAATAGEVAVPVTLEDRVYQGATTLSVVRGAGLGTESTRERYLVSEQSPAPLAPGSRALLCWDPRHTVVLRDG